MKEWSCFCLYHLADSHVPPFISFGSHWEGRINHIRHSRRVALICLALLFLCGGLPCPPFYVFSLGLSVTRLEPPCPARGWAQTLSLSQLWLVQELENNPSSIRVFSLVDIERKREKEMSSDWAHAAEGVCLGLLVAILSSAWRDMSSEWYKAETKRVEMWREKERLNTIV